MNHEEAQRSWKECLKSMMCKCTGWYRGVGDIYCIAKFLKVVSYGTPASWISSLKESLRGKILRRLLPALTFLETHEVNHLIKGSQKFSSRASCFTQHFRNRITDSVTHFPTQISLIKFVSSGQSLVNMCHMFKSLWKTENRPMHCQRSQGK